MGFERVRTLAAGVIEFLGRIDIAEDGLGRKTLGGNFFFFHQQGAYFSKQWVDLVSAREQRALGHGSKAAAVDRAKRLGAVGGARDSNQGIRALGHPDQVLEEFEFNKRQIDGQYEIQIRRGSGQGGMDSTKRPAFAEHVFDHGAISRKLVSLSDDDDFGSYGACKVESALKESTSLELEQSLIRAHADALPSRKDKSSDIVHDCHNTCCEPESLKQKTVLVRSFCLEEVYTSRLLGHIEGTHTLQCLEVDHHQSARLRAYAFGGHEGKAVVG